MDVRAIPEEVWVHIMSYMHASTLMNMARTCRYMHYIVSERADTLDMSGMILNDEVIAKALCGFRVHEGDAVVKNMNIKHIVMDRCTFVPSSYHFEKWPVFECIESIRITHYSAINLSPIELGPIMSAMISRSKNVKHVNVHLFSFLLARAFCICTSMLSRCQMVTIDASPSTFTNIMSLDASNIGELRIRITGEYQSSTDVAEAMYRHPEACKRVYSIAIDGRIIMPLLAHDSIAAAIARQCVNVTHIDLSSCCELTDEGLLSLRERKDTMVSLSIMRCTGVTCGGVSALVTCCPGMVYINMVGVSCKDGRCVDHTLAIAEACPKLEEMHTNVPFNTGTTVNIARRCRRLVSMSIGALSSCHEATMEHSKGMEDDGEPFVHESLRSFMVRGSTNMCDEDIASVSRLFPRIRNAFFVVCGGFTEKAVCTIIEECIQMENLCIDVDSWRRTYTLDVHKCADIHAASARRSPAVKVFTNLLTLYPDGIKNIWSTDGGVQRCF